MTALAFPREAGEAGRALGGPSFFRDRGGSVPTFPVGTLISERPPDNPSEPNSGTRLLPWVSNGEPHAGPRMEYLRLREKLICQFRHLRP